MINHCTWRTFQLFSQKACFQISHDLFKYLSRYLRENNCPPKSLKYLILTSGRVRKLLLNRCPRFVVFRYSGIILFQSFKSRETGWTNALDVPKGHDWSKNHETEWSIKDGISSVLTEKIKLLNRVLLASSVLWPRRLRLNLFVQGLNYPQNDVPAIRFDGFPVCAVILMNCSQVRAGPFLNFFCADANCLWLAHCVFNLDWPKSNYVWYIRSMQPRQTVRRE